MHFVYLVTSSYFYRILTTLSRRSKFLTSCIVLSCVEQSKPVTTFNVCSDVDQPETLSAYINEGRRKL